MHIALDIADDVLMAVKDRARRQKRSVGDLLSELAREALTHQSFYGFAPFPSRSRSGFVGELELSAYRAFRQNQVVQLREPGARLQTTADLLSTGSHEG